MRPKTVEEIVANVEALRLRQGDLLAEVAHITHDSREVKPGTLFVALRGARFDGHSFVERAIENGAAAVLVDENFDDEIEGATLLECADTRDVLAELGAAFYDHPSREMTLVGITGTNGKTSTTYLLEAIFRARGLLTGVIGTVEYRWGEKRARAPNTTPDGLVLQRYLRAMADDGVELAVLEVSSHGLETGRVRGVHFEAAVFTNLSQDHLDFHPTMEAYRDAKRKLFYELLPVSETQTGAPPVAAINADDAEGRALLESLQAFGDQIAVKSFGIAERGGVDFAGQIEEEDVYGVRLRVEEQGGDPFVVRSSLPGRFNAENVLGAVAVARLLGVSKEEVVAGLASFRGVPGRMERVGDSQGPAVFVDYAHTPDALKRALETLRPLTEGKLWVVFGCGGDRDRSKRPLMGQVAGSIADVVVVTSDNPRRESEEAIIDAVVEGITSVESHPALVWFTEVDRAEAIKAAIGRADAKDVILIAGKGHETYQEVNGTRRAFDDREVASSALAMRGESTC